mmetsp:Transcript_12136/g.35126  ORF Transcript_12136/g.35126 Transcript_12136/m.35126 type:complete len:322 (-) Transcript_12136:1919-2884(-)
MPSLCHWAKRSSSSWRRAGFSGARGGSRCLPFVERAGGPVGGEAEASLMMARRTKFGYRCVVGSGRLVTGERSCASNQIWMAPLSYVKPSAATTGSTKISKVSGQRNSFGGTRDPLKLKDVWVVSILSLTLFNLRKASLPNDLWRSGTSTPLCSCCTARLKSSRLASTGAPGEGPGEGPGDTGAAPPVLLGGVVSPVDWGSCSSSLSAVAARMSSASADSPSSSSPSSPVAPSSSSSLGASSVGRREELRGERLGEPGSSSTAAPPRMFSSISACMTRLSKFALRTSSVPAMAWTNPRTRARDWAARGSKVMETPCRASSL